MAISLCFFVCEMNFSAPSSNYYTFKKRYVDIFCSRDFYKALHQVGQSFNIINDTKQTHIDIFISGIV